MNIQPSIGSRVRARNKLDEYSSSKRKLRSYSELKQTVDEFDFNVKKKKKKKKVCQSGTVPSVYGWKYTMWDGYSRRSWSMEAQAMMVGLCEECDMVMGAQLDHVVQFQEYINIKADLYVFCDGTCHFLGVHVYDAKRWYNDVGNLRWLCQGCHGQKKNKKDLASSATVVGECPSGECQEGKCNADYCF